MNVERPALLRVHPDRSEHVAELTGTFRLARYGVGYCRPDELGMMRSEIRQRRCV